MKIWCKLSMRAFIIMWYLYVSLNPTHATYNWYRSEWIYEDSTQAIKQFVGASCKMSQDENQFKRSSGLQPLTAKT